MLTVMPFLRRAALSAAAVATAVFIIPAPPASASSLGVEPLFLQISPTQSAAIRVSNPSDVVQSVEVYIHERQIDGKGAQTRIPADDDFIVFPPQAAIKAGSTQVFRIQPISPDLSKSRSYFVTMRQVPVDYDPADGDAARLRVVFAFDAAVHVIPDGAESEVVARDARMGTTSIRRSTGEYRLDEDTGEQIEVMEDVTIPAAVVTVENLGNKFEYAQNLDFDLSGTAPDGSSADFPDWSVDEIIKGVRVVLIPPGTTRELALPLPEGFQATNVAADVELRSGL